MQHELNLEGIQYNTIDTSSSCYIQSSVIISYQQNKNINS